MNRASARVMTSLLTALLAWGAVGPVPAAAVTPSTWVVNSTADDSDGSCDPAPGDCTFREAIAAAEGDGAASRIEFAIPGAGPHTITSTGLVITQPTVVDASTQPGASCPGTILVELTAATTGSGTGLHLGNPSAASLADGVRVTGLAITGFSTGIRLGGAFNGGGWNTVTCSFVGLRPDGTTRGNGNGIVGDPSGNNRIGGANAADRNVISGNGTSGSGHGVWFSGGSGNVIRGNYVGTDPTGSNDAGNGGTGVFFQSASGSVEGNVISGNGGSGVATFAGTAVVTGNRIGTDAAGTGPLGNDSHGVSMINGGGGRVGGTASGDGNVIAFNGASGIDATSCCFAPASLITIQGNAIHSNGGPGIEIGAGANDPDDADATGGGANELQNHPVLAEVSRVGGQITVEGTLDSNPSETFAIELFANATCDPTGFGEGAVFLGRTSATTDASGDATFSATFADPDPGLQFVTATATDADGRTSEFSRCFTGSTLVVNDPGDDVDAGGCQSLPDGDCTLREAVGEANANAAIRRIHFAIPGAGPHTITLGSALLPTGSYTIDASTQPGASCPDDHGVRLVPASTGYAAFRTSGDGATGIRGFVIVGFDPGIWVDGGANKVITCNYVGLDVDGSTAHANSVGIRLHNGCCGSPVRSTRIGGSVPADRNVVSGNTAEGIVLHTGFDNAIVGNYIGTDATGILDRGNGSHGINAFLQDGARIGGPSSTPGTGAGNVVSGNGANGVQFTAGSGLIRGNVVGADVTGLQPLPNDGDGINQFGIIGRPVTTIVGGPNRDDANVIAFNGGAGFQGTSCCFPGTRDTSILHNAIWANGGEGIDIGAPVNDPLDADGGANDQQNHPELSGASLAGPNTVIAGSLHSTPDSTFIIELFASDTCERQGRRFLGTTTAFTDANGDATFRATVAGHPVGNEITGTATAAAGATSEFSPCVTLDRTSSQPNTLTLTAVDPDRGSKAGTASTVLSGAGFGPGLEVRLRRGGTDIEATVVTVHSWSGATASFDLRAAVPGTYDVEVERDGEVARLSAAYEVVDGPAGAFVATAHITPVIRARSEANAWISYENIGGTDVPARLLAVRIENGTFVAEGDPTQQQFFAAAPTGDAGILTPGSRGLIPLRVRAGAAEDPRGELMPVRIEILETPTDATPVDWDALRTPLRPSGADEAAWNAVYDVLTSSAATYPAYETQLARAATALSRVGIYTTDISRLFNFLIHDHANGYPHRVLVAEVDAAAPGAGAALRFDRIYLQSALQRLQDGDLGRGWTHTWDYAVRDLGANIELRTPTGAFVYRLLAGSTYVTADDARTRIVDLGDGYRLELADGSRYLFNDQGRLARHEDAHGRAIVVTRDTAGRLVRLTHVTGDRIDFGYTAEGRIATLTDHAGRVTTYAYADGNLVSVAGPRGETEYGYISTGAAIRRHALESITTPAGGTTTFGYDAVGRLIGWTEPGGIAELRMAYGLPGEVTTTDALGGRWLERYNDAAQQAAVVTATGELWSFERDGLGRLERIVRPDGTFATFGYAHRSQLARVVDPGGHEVSWTYGSALDLPLEFAEDGGVDVAYEYDGARRPTVVRWPDGTTERFAYDTAGNLVEITNRRGQTMQLTYDSRGLLTRRDHADGSADTYSYDPRGNLVSATNAAGTTRMSWDAADRLTMVEQPGGRSLTYRYTAGRLAEVEDQDGFIVRYGYDPSGRVTEVHAAATLVARFAYDAAGRIARREAGNGATASYRYDAAGRLTQLVNAAPDGTTLSSFAHEYDVLGRRITTRTGDGIATWSHDAVGNLIAGYLPGGPSLEYAYHPTGSRQSVRRDGVTTTYTVNDLAQYTAVGDAARTYDADGNLLSVTTTAGTTTYQYNQDSRLIEVDGPGGRSRFEYDALGHLVASEHDGERTEYLVDVIGPGTTMGDYAQDGSLLARYANVGPGPVARLDPAGEAAYYLFDTVGSTTELLADDGSVLNRYAYLPFGEESFASESIRNRYRFNGGVGVATDRSGLLLMRQRAYEPATGAFTAIDPLREPPTGLYAFAFNNPIQFVDVDGRAGGVIGNGACWSDTLGEVVPCNTLNPVDAKDKGVADGLANLQKLDPCTVPSGLFTITAGTQVGGGVADKCKKKYDPPPGTVPGSDASAKVNKAIDPNTIIGPNGAPASRFLRSSDDLDYAILFENLPTATAPAQEVVITIDLDDANIDPATVELDGASFGAHLGSFPGGTPGTIRIDARSARGLDVDVTASIDTSTGVLEWRFVSIDPATGRPTTDALAGFLPPNDASGDGQGWVTFRAKPVAGLVSGDTIPAQARIVFDTEPPLDTPIWTNVVDDDPPASAVDALPATTTTTSFTVSWTGDALGGSDITGYDIYVSTDGGAYDRWLEATTDTSATFDGELGKTYAFYSVATDAVGHREADPVDPDAVTTLDDGSPTDNDPPETTITDGPADGSQVTATSATFTFESNEGGSTFSCALDDADPVACDAGTATYDNLAPGSHTFAVAATDPAGNVDPSPATRSWRVQATTSVLYTGSQVLAIGSKLSPKATLSASHASCVPGQLVTFLLDDNPTTATIGDGPFSVGSGTSSTGGLVAAPAIVTTGWREGVYQVTAAFAGTANCLASSDEVTLTVAAAGTAAHGGGFYTLAGSGRINLGFTVRQVPKSNPVAHTGQLLLINNGKWRLKGSLDSYVRPATGRGLASGTGRLQWWDPAAAGGAGDWVVAAESVTFTITFTDGGSGKKAVDTFGIDIRHSPVSPQPPLPNSAPQQLKGGNLVVT